MANGLVAIISLLMALFMAGGDTDQVQVIEYEVTFDISLTSIALHVDPVFLVYTDRWIPAAGCAFGNTILMADWLQGDPRHDYILHYELNHVRQCQGLGWLIWPAHLFFDIDPFRGEHPVECDWDNPAQTDELMWMPPSWLRMWHWFTVEVRFG